MDCVTIKNVKNAVADRRHAVRTIEKGIMVVRWKLGLLQTKFMSWSERKALKNLSISGHAPNVLPFPSRRLSQISFYSTPPPKSSQGSQISPNFIGNFEDVVSVSDLIQ